jgi:hypothetical protein
MKFAKAVNYTKLLVRGKRFTHVAVGNGIAHNSDLVHQNNNTATATVMAQRSV